MTSIGAHPTTTMLSGLASGLNTQAMVAALMGVAQQPMTDMQAKVGGYQADIKAWQSVSTKLTALQTAVNALKNPSDLAAMATAGSSSNAVIPAVTGSPAPGTVSFTVDQLAQAHQVVSATTFGSASDLVGAGTFSITLGSNPVPFNFTTTAGTTYGQLAQQISSSAAGVSASVVAVDGTTAKLVLTARTTGATSAFTASGTQPALSSFNLLQQGQDAKITIGSGANAVVLSRSGNQVNDLMPGVSLNLQATSTTPVTITVQQDVAAMVNAVQNLVTAYNGAVTTLSGLTSYDATNQTAGQLMADSTAQALGGKLNDAMSSVVSGLTGNLTSAASLGITVQLDGTLQLNQSTLFSALTANPAAVSTLLSRSGKASDARITSVAGTDLTHAGSYAVAITQAASQASATGSAYAAPATDQTFTIASGTTTASVSLTAADGESAALVKIKIALQAAGLSQLTALDNGSGAIRLQDSSYGAAATFTVAGSGALGLDGTYAGTDVAGTIDGQAAHGAGQSLFSSAGPASGLAVRITATPADVSAAGGALALGTATLTQGIAGRLSSLLNRTVGLTGSISDATNLYNAEITDVQSQMADLQVLLDEKQTILQQQFAAMEAALSSLQAQSQAVAAAFGGGGSSSGSSGSGGGSSVGPVAAPTLSTGTSTTSTPATTSSGTGG